MAHARLFSKNTMRGTVVTVSAFIALAACSSSNKATSPDGGGANEDAGPVYTVSNCPSGGTIGDSCVKCLSSLCTPELVAVNTACATAFACVCPVGVDANSCPVPSEACTTAATSARTTCTGCTSICGGSGTGGGDGGPSTEAGGSHDDGGGDSSVDAPTGD